MCYHDKIGKTKITTVFAKKILRKKIAEMLQWKLKPVAIVCHPVHPVGDTLRARAPLGRDTHTIYIICPVRN